MYRVTVKTFCHSIWNSSWCICWIVLRYLLVRCLCYKN